MKMNYVNVLSELYNEQQVLYYYLKKSNNETIKNQLEDIEKTISKLEREREKNLVI